MNFELLDEYLLAGGGSKHRIIDALLGNRDPAPAALPFYRALEAVGPRAADETLIALRLVLAGKKPSDDAVRRLRTIIAASRSADDPTEARAEYRRALD
ncbi:MAG: hypothetical protein DLM50_01550 [Candidatus Meridianibacter frigidus]|nr:MAG: hypothetical protein DLM50_01550 [Candidatus Eremiobacteraeota bacterium]